MADPKIILSAVDDTKQAFASARQGLGNLETQAKSVTGALAALGAPITAGGFALLVKGAIDASDHLNDLSKSTGLAVEDLAGLKLLARQSGTDLDGLAKGINRMSVEMGKAPEKFAALGITATDSKEALKQFSDLFIKLPDINQRNALAQAVFNKSWGEMAPALSEGGKKIGETIEKGARLSAVTKDLAEGSDAFNDKLAELTGTGGLMNRQLAPMLPMLNALADDMLEAQDNTSGLAGEFHPLAETMRAAVILGGNVSFVLKGIGTEAGGMAAQLAALARGDLAGFAAIGDMMKKDADTARAAFDKWEAKMLSVGTVAKQTAKSVTEMSEADKKAAADAAARAAAFLKEKQPDKESAYVSVNKAVMERIVTQGRELQLGRELTEMEKLEAKALEDLNLSKVKVSEAERKDIQDKLAAAKAQESLIAKQRQDEKDQYIAFKVWEDEQTAIAEVAKKMAQRQIDQVATAQKTLEQIEFENSLLGMNNQQREVAIALHQLEVQGIKEGTKAYAEYADRIKDAVSKRSLMNEAVENFKGMWESIDQTAHDVWTNVWHGGSDVFKRLGQTLKASVLDVLYQMVVKKWVFNIFANVSGAASNVVNSVGNGVMQGSMAGMVGGGSSLLGAGAGIGSGFMNGLSAWGSTGSVAGVLGNPGLYSIAELAGVIAPIGIGVAALLSLAKGGETRTGGQYSNATFLQGPSGGEINGDATRQAIQSTIDSVNGTLKALGSGATLGNFQSGFESSKNGKGFAYAGGQLSTGQIFGQGVGGYGWENRRGSMTPEEAANAFAEELKQATLQALQVADVPGKLGDYLRQLGDIDQLSGGALDTAIAKINKALTEKQQLEAKIFDLTATDGEKLTKVRNDERAAIDDTNRDLLERLYALQDEKAATEAATTAAQAHTDALNSARSDLASAYGREKSAIESTQKRLEGFTNKLSAFRDTLIMGDLSPLTPGQKYAQAATDYAITVAKKNSGDLDAIDRFDSVAQAFLQASRDYNASGDQYVSDFNQVYAETEKTVSIAKLQYDAQEENLKKLDAMVSGLVDVKDAVMSVAEAVWRLGMTQPGAGGTVTNAYATLLNRSPDVEGFNYWAAHLAGGMSTEEMTRLITSSPEYLATHSNARGGVGRGLSVVGEQGRELVDFRTPGRVYSNDQMRAAFGGGDREQVQELRSIAQDLRRLLQQHGEGVRAVAEAQRGAALEAAQTIVRGVAGAASQTAWQERMVQRRAVPGKAVSA